MQAQKTTTKCASGQKNVWFLVLGSWFCLFSYQAQGAFWRQFHCFVHSCKMFYAQLVLAKKGALGKVWLAAHWDRKLTKTQINSTDISKSVGVLFVSQQHHKTKNNKNKTQQNKNKNKNKEIKNEANQRNKNQANKKKKNIKKLQPKQNKTMK